MSDFDKACAAFTAACRRAANWKENYYGAAYVTRIDNARSDVVEAYNRVFAAHLDAKVLPKSPSAKAGTP